ncbi:MAG: hypothetical protein NZP74_09565 [Anaerolineales bacterium]|nr:hypothetical protein [Anaerolineales bacterium]MDW8277399.1 hypothetical protein [Anaerolineales bacterium]
MSLSQVLEVALGLALTYYLMSMVVSWMCQFVMTTFETRGRTLESVLRRIVGGKALGQLLSMPQIRSLAPVRYQDWRSLFSRNVQLVEKRVERIPVSNLLDAFFDLAKLDIAANSEELVELINKLPPSEGKTELLRLVNSGVSSVLELRAKMALWFEGLMQQASEMFAAMAKRYVVFFSLALTLLLGVDSIDLFRQLWATPDMRAIASVKAQAYIAQYGYDADTEPLLADLEQLTIHIGWSSVLKNAPSLERPDAFVRFWFLKLLGLLMTTIAVAQGAPFWYDLLRKMTSVKSPGSNPSRSEETASSEAATRAYG